MKRLILILLFAFFVVGCGSNEPETAVEPTVEQVEVATNDEEAVEQPTAEPVAEVDVPTVTPEEDPTEEPAEEATAEPEEETAVESAPIVLGDPTQIRESDWVQGAENGRIVIIEYGDFQ